MPPGNFSKVRDDNFRAFRLDFRILPLMSGTLVIPDIHTEFEWIESAIAALSPGSRKGRRRSTPETAATHVQN